MVRVCGQLARDASSRSAGVRGLDPWCFSTQLVSSVVRSARAPTGEPSALRRGACWVRKAQKAGPFTGLLPVGVGVAWAAWAVAVAATAAVECEAFSVYLVVPLPAQPATARSKPARCASRLSSVEVGWHGVCVRSVWPTCGAVPCRRLGCWRSWRSRHLSGLSGRPAVRRRPPPRRRARRSALS